ncbi:MAG TPA: alkaline phosphatase [Edaphobacter sp.]|nr:alkaline phosphatase [Edaphobacter sp.]
MKKQFVKCLLVSMLSFAVLAASLFCVRSASAKEPVRARVILFGVDGLSTEGIQDANAPNMHALMKSGAWTMHMRSVRPTISAPNWASMIMGAPVEMTGVTSNAWNPSSPPYPPSCEAAPGVFPTILGIEHQQHPEAKIGVFTDWSKFAHLFEPGAATKVVDHGTSHEDVFRQALAYLESARPDLLMIHMDTVDDAGSKGWGSPEYLAAVAEVDEQLGRLLATLDRLNLRKSTTVLLVADHGGKGDHHGGDSIQEIQVPWIISGPGIKVDYEIKDRSLMTYDTAATIARILDVKPSPCWRGRSIEDSFVKPRKR